MAFSHDGQHHRFNLNNRAVKPRHSVMSKTEAESLHDLYRSQIRAGTFDGAKATHEGDSRLSMRDVAKAYALLLERGEAGQAYNVASGQGQRLRDVVAALVARARVPIEVEEEASRLRPNDVPYLVGDPTRLKEATGWKPVHPFEDTLGALLEAARSARASLVEGGA